MRMPFVVLSVLCAGTLVVASSAGAQEQGRVGLTMGYPAAVGVVWHVSDRVALRPEFTISTTSGEATSSGTTLTSTGDGWSAGAGLAALLYVRQWENVRAYLSPRMTYMRSSVDSGVASGIGAASTSTNTVYSVSGSIGVQCSLGRRLGVFGEVGYAYNHSDSTYQSGSTSTDSITRTTGVRTGAGVIFWF